ncbi:hypothetical protein [Gilvimarinus sp. DA14]|uniref:hypothetical protein n=1 Tax=Gilvimarinus sp. DA14 TaxID=2956798 RepID=UPI0020B7F03B|nr:hypothetical protein [Gilvimarinus sp. DA14]UTF61647.1 hypothetical protein NHM04_07615 [Gilvimarinus sp. DA14]
MPDQQNFNQEFLGSREISFTNRQESIYPTLMRFCLDFKFKVLQVLFAPQEGSPPSKMLVMTRADYAGNTEGVITPAFTQLEQLERYVCDNQIDILHDYLFGVDELAQQTG